MAEDAAGGLHNSRDLTAPVTTPELSYSNSHHQRVGPRWVRGEAIQAMPLGIVQVDPAQTKWAKEYVTVYRLEGADGRSERVPGQDRIDDFNPAAGPRALLEARGIAPEVTVHSY